MNNFCKISSAAPLLLAGVAVFSWGTLTAGARSPQNEIEIFLDQSQRPAHHGAVAIRGLERELLMALRGANLTPPQWQQAFAVYTGAQVPSQDGSKPAILGEYRIKSGLVRFYPRFPFVKGLSYSAKLELSLLYSFVNLDFPTSLQKRVEASFLLPKPEVEPTTIVTEVFPTATEIPANQLKFYIYFSAPMSRGRVYAHIDLVDAANTRVPAVFLEVEPELWDANTQRLTIFFDPGRIKRGLRPHRDLGLALQEGLEYRLVVDRDLRDADGNPLVERFEKKFKVKTADRKSPDYNHWKLFSPEVGTRTPVTLDFEEPLDHALLAWMLSVKKTGGRTVHGQPRITNEEKQWQFIPDKSWSQGDYIIEVNPALEDLAGNKLDRLFDVDVESSGTKPADIKRITFSFSIPTNAHKSH